MKIIGLAIYCTLLCSLLTLFSCTKSNIEATAFDQNKVNGKLLNGDAVASTDFMPGDSLVVKADTSNGDMTALLHSAGESTPYFPSLTATDYGALSTNRSLMKFKLRGISDSLRNNPPQIKKAVLYLYQYHRPADRDPYSIKQTGDNSIEVHRIVEDWDYNTLTWGTQPAVAKGAANPLEDVVVIPAVKTPLPAGTNDDQVVDITDMVRRIIEYRNNKGFLFKLSKQGEMTAGAGRAYGSPACPVASKRPRLVIYF